MILLLTAEEGAPVNVFILSRPIRDDQTLRHFKQIETHETYCFKPMRHAKHILMVKEIIIRRSGMKSELKNSS